MPDRFVIVVSQHLYPDLTKESLVELLSGCLKPESYHLIAVPDDKRYILNPTVHLDSFGNEVA